MLSATSKRAKLSLQSLRTFQRRTVYEDTRFNLAINSQTRVVIQGLTGRQGTFDAKQSLEYGTKIVGGIKPGGSGEHLGLPIVGSMREAMEKLKPDATAVYVAAPHAANAIEEAIEAEVPLIVAVAEHIPIHDMIRVNQMLRTQSKSRLLGANTPGMINPHAKCRIGFPPLPFYQPGKIGIVAKSGTLSYETVASTTRAGLGQSLVIGIGGDPLPGTDMVDALMVLENDPNTEAIAIVGELGGYAEEDAAAWITEYRRRTPNAKPIAALIGGVDAVAGRVMGHAGAFQGRRDGSARSKLKALQRAGVRTIDHPAKFGTLLTSLLNERGSRGYATSARPMRRTGPLQQKRAYTVSSSTALGMLSEAGMSTSESSSKDAIPITMHINRRTYLPEISIGHEDAASNISIPYLSGPSADEQHASAIAHSLSQTNVDYPSRDALSTLLCQLTKVFFKYEAVSISLLATPSSNGYTVSSPRFNLDNASVVSSTRQNATFSKRSTEGLVPEEITAESSGIVYIRLPSPGSIGTLVNGAGLAMNTVDALIALGGKPANFLDTGGKATAVTVKKSFELILSDKNVKVIFVNIFGGLTLCDMIAEGVITAYKDLKIELPVVVRLRGSSERKGQDMIAQSGLPLHAFDDFEEAAAKAIDFANA